MGDAATHNYRQAVDKVVVDIFSRHKDAGDRAEWESLQKATQKATEEYIEEHLS
jgi:hypothetical protein